MGELQIHVGVGIPSLLVIFISLCLTTFACLCAASAAADYRLAQKTAQGITQYYSADGAGEQALAQLDVLLHTPGDKSPAQLGWSFPPETPSLLCRSIPINDRQTLQITVDISHPNSLQVTRWQVENTAPWQEEDGLTLWDGPPIG